jgi:LysM repeat protein
MRPKNILTGLFLIAFLGGLLRPTGKVFSAPMQSNYAPAGGATAYDLIAAMNTLRMSNGLSALIEDSIVNAVAQTTAEIMAANEMSWHIGDVRGRLAAAGYGGGATVWATENFAVGVGGLGIDEIMVMWSDPDHMRPAVVAAYCHVGAGVAKSPSGRIYYVLQAAYTSEHACGPYNYPGDSGVTPQPGTGSNMGPIVPVKLATPDAEGRIYHVVEFGQSLWAIAVAYHITIHDLEVWNNISRESPIRVGQRLFIPSNSTAGYFTPTPVGMIVLSTPDADGKIIHTVQPYEALISIAQAYKVTVDAILSLNGIQADWPLQIGQKLVITPGWITPSPTPRPLTPVEKLTPASDGNYYHVVQSGETLSWIAALYTVSLADLMAWNGLNNASIIRPDQKLLLRVTPPATQTYTPRPPTATATITKTPLPHTATRTPTRAALHATTTATPTPAAQGGISGAGWLSFIGVAVVGLILAGLYFRRKSGSTQAPTPGSPQQKNEGKGGMGKEI